MFVYDVTRPETVRSLEDHWVPMVWRLVGRIPLVVAGNKADLLGYRSHAREVLGYLEQKFDGSRLLTGAKNGEQVEETFGRLAARIVGYRGRPPDRVAVATLPQDEVDRLARVEGDFKTPEQIAVNRARRLAWLEGRDFI